MTMASVRIRSLSVGGTPLEPAVPKLPVASIEFDAYGDVMLNLSSPSGIARFRVNSNILCLASPVFRAMLGANSRFKEGVALASRSATSAPLEISLEDDDPNALAIILRLIHLQHDWTPPSLNEDQLYLVAVLCDKYDMRQSLELGLEKWLAPISTTTVTGDNWLFILFAFGRKDEFSRLSKDMILNYQSDKDGNLLSADGKAISVHIPGHIIAEISARRQQVIESMVDCIHSVIEEYADPENLKCTEQKGTCTDYHLGFLFRTFKRLKFYPEASHITTQSLSELKRLLDGVSLPGDFQLAKQNQNQSLTCTNCNYTNTPINGNCRSCGTSILNATHAACSPIPAYSGKIQELFDGIKGLDYASFVREPTLPKQVAALKSGSHLWDCLAYK